MKARVICLAVILITACAAKDVQVQNIPDPACPAVRAVRRFQDLLPVNDISHAREEPISQKIRENVTLLHAHLAVNRARASASGVQRRRVNYLLLVAVLGDVRKHEEW